MHSRISTLFFSFLFLEMGRSLRATQHFFFLAYYVIEKNILRKGSKSGGYILHGNGHKTMIRKGVIMVIGPNQRNQNKDITVRHYL